MPKASLIIAVLAIIYGVRMLGLFMLLPVLEPYGAQLAAASIFTIGLAMGAYGLMQLLLQIPFALLSNRIGRRNALIAGLLLFVLGCWVAYSAQSIYGVIAGRILQGSGAIAGILLASIGDWVPPSLHVRANAFIGMSIGLALILALVLGPIVAYHWGLDAVFLCNGATALLAIILVYRYLPSHIKKIPSTAPIKFSIELKYLSIGILLLHAVLAVTFLLLPNILVETAGFDLSRHWLVYLCTLLLAGLIAMPLARRRDAISHRLLLQCALLLCCGLLLMAIGSSSWVIMAGLTLFFAGFGALEALLPALFTRYVHEKQRGLGGGLYSTAQFTGAFLGAAGGGLLLSYWHGDILFIAVAPLMLIWALFFVLFLRTRASAST